METWFVKSILATVTIVPAFIAIPFFKFSCLWNSKIPIMFK